MKFKNVLVPFDSSDHAVNALKTARNLVGDNPSARIHVVNVIPENTLEPPMTFGHGVPYEGVPLEALSHSDYRTLVETTRKRVANEVRAAIGHTLDNMGDRATVEVLVRPVVANALVAYAEEHGCDLIVMGRRGAGALRTFLGSTSREVLHATNLPVLTVK